MQRSGQGKQRTSSMYAPYITYSYLSARVAVLLWSNVPSSGVPSSASVLCNASVKRSSFDSGYTSVFTSSSRSVSERSDRHCKRDTRSKCCPSKSTATTLNRSCDAHTHTLSSVSLSCKGIANSSYFLNPRGKTRCEHICFAPFPKSNFGCFPFG